MKEILEKSGYIVLVTLIILGILLLMRKLRSDALVELRKTLYIEHDPVKYLSMLKSRNLKLVLRKGTLQLMELEGLLYTGNRQETERVIAELETAKLSKAEKLDFYQRKLSYYLSAGDKERATESYKLIDKLLEKETDEKLVQIRSEAKLLVDVYVRHDVSRLNHLLEKAKHQKGVQLGITQFRIAKLYHFKKDDASAKNTLREAAANLKGTSWASIVEQAIKDTSLLEKY